MKIKKTISTVIVLGLIAAAIVIYLRKEGEQPVSYRTAAITRGDLLVSISATGTVEPEEVIDVGAQVAGQILKFGIDKNGKSVDYGSVVEAGTVLAQIDDSLYAADAASAAAQVQQSRAALQNAIANMGQLNAKLYQARQDWERAQKIGPSEALAQSSYDAYKAAYDAAAGNVAVGQAAIMQARAAVAQSEAALKRARRNLEYCTITSPVKGVIIDRRVNIGQTVVSSLSAPSLFLIAKDLKRMQVWVAVNEADIGKIYPGQPVSFTVDAFPGETFRGEVGKVRLNASMTQNVVTYTVEVITDNSSGRLLPYLTANVQFEMNHLHNVLLAPNAALRWTPAEAQISPEFRSVRSEALKEKAVSAPESQQGRAVSDKKSPENRASGQKARKKGALWIRQGNFVAPIAVTTGPTDGILTEVQGDNLKEGMEVVLGQQTAEAAPTGSTNPFLPQMGKGRKGGHG